jgi:hypothetical protein
MSILLALLPDNALVLVIMIAAFGLIIGVINRAIAFRIVGMIVLYAMLSPFISSLFDYLPPWLVTVLEIAFILSIARWILSALFGRRSTDHFVGILMWNLFAFPFRFLGYLFGARRAR